MRMIGIKKPTSQAIIKKLRNSKKQNSNTEIKYQLREFKEEMINLIKELKEGSHITLKSKMKKIKFLFKKLTL